MFLILNAASRINTFQNIVGRDTNAGVFCDVNCDANSVSLDAWQALPGDTDGDRDVDVTDFQVCRLSFQTSGTMFGWIDGNSDNEKDVDITDFELILLDFAPLGYGAAVGPSAPIHAVPEPTGGAIGFLTGFLLLI